MSLLLLMMRRRRRRTCRNRRGKLLLHSIIIIIFLSNDSSLVGWHRLGFFDRDRCNDITRFGVERLELASQGADLLRDKVVALVEKNVAQIRDRLELRHQAIGERAELVGHFASTNGYAEESGIVRLLIITRVVGR